MTGRYDRFFLMIGASMAAMFAATYLNSWSVDHVFWSTSRVYMVFYMGAVMAVVMIGFMWGMYPNKRLNALIVGAAMVVFVASVALMRGQVGIGDTGWMRAMIPHHSIAILTSSRAELEDPRVRRLADDIISAQRREIAEMKALITDLEGGPEATAAIDGR